MSTPQRTQVETLGRLDRSEVDAITWLLEAATEQDGMRPLSEQVTLPLRYGGDDASRNVLLYAPDGSLAGYGQLDVTDEVEGGSAELVVHPAHRGRGYGRVLTQTLLDETPDGRLRLWAHGGSPAANHLALSMGFEKVRELWQMRRSLYAPLSVAAPPDGVVMRTFRPGVDDKGWVALNRRAFRHHPEQGKWTLADLRRRMAEPWFDPAGFFIAEREGRPVGFHWTKVHSDHRKGERPGDQRDEPIGEVYVVGVDPDAQGGGLGRALTLAGLEHLRSRGLGQVMLYVDADNLPAVAVYRALGFSHVDTDVMFRHPASTG